MSLDELLPAVRCLPQADKVRLIKLLADDLVVPSAVIAEILSLPLPGAYPIWSPYDSVDAASALLAALDNASHA